LEGVKESIALFGNKNKPERERWVCKQFLKNLDVPFEEADIQTPDTDPPDVEFATARFEIKEILDPGRKRHDELKHNLAKAQNVSRAEDLTTMYVPKDITPAALCDLIRSHAVNLGVDYLANQRHNIDLLFYVNLKHHTLDDESMPPLTELKRLGWRSITAVMHKSSFILYMAEDAPCFLTERGISATTGDAYVY
jgi:hypothetical protein